MTVTEIAAPVESPAKPVQRTSPDTRGRTKPKRQPPHAVVLHNDNLNSMEHVVSVLRKVFNYGLLKSTRLMIEAHTRGRCIVWSGALEVAELKAEQMRSAGPDPVMKAHGAMTLRVSVEPLPG